VVEDNELEIERVKSGLKEENGTLYVELETVLNTFGQSGLKVIVNIMFLIGFDFIYFSIINKHVKT
jgi:hypothetical protein